MTTRPRGVAVVVAGVLGAALSAAVVASEPSAIRRGDARAYRVLDPSRRLPTLDRGGTVRTLAAGPWQPTPPPDDPTNTSRDARRQIVEAACDADLVVLGRVASSVPFPHPNGRWVATAHDLVVSRVLRTRTPSTARPARLRYVHPSGELDIGGRTVRATVDRFPPIVSDEEAMFFLVRIGRGPGYRTSLALPPMALRGGVLDGLGRADGAAGPEPAAGLSVLEAVRLPNAAVCRPAPIQRSWLPRSGDAGRLPPLGQPSPVPGAPP